jgi:hypothetical protein
MDVLEEEEIIIHHGTVDSLDNASAFLCTLMEQHHEVSSTMP